MTVISKTTETGVVAESDGKYWGVIHQGVGHGEGTAYGFGDISAARIGNPEYCLSATSFTYKGSSDYLKLSSARLVSVKKITTYEVEEC